MPSSFPGMDPYLENPEIFPDFHDSVITYLREILQANLPAPYFAVLGRRVWIEVSRRSKVPTWKCAAKEAGQARFERSQPVDWHWRTLPLESNRKPPRAATIPQTARA